MFGEMQERTRFDRLGSPALILGFEAETLQELRAAVDVQVVISGDPSADIKWNALQFLALDLKPSIWNSEQRECFAHVRSFFFEFANIYSRRYQYVSEPIPEIQHAFIVTFNICYRIIKDSAIKLLIFSNIPHEGYDYIFYRIARYLNLGIVMCYQSLIPNRFFLCSNIDKFGEFERSPAIVPLEKSNYRLPENWFYMNGAPADQSYQLRALIAGILKNPRGLGVALMRHYYATRYRRNAKAATKAGIDGEKYIYFPLHLQPELTTSALGGDYADQLTAVEILSGLVPKGYRILAKENPKQTELERGPLFFRRLNALPNVNLVSRDLNSIDLIRGSEGVATITGTAGWEALFYGKPVLIFGRAWYASMPGVTRYEPNVDFDAFVRNFPPIGGQIVEALDRLLTRTGKGVVDPAYAGLVGGFDRAANARSVCESILAYLK